VTWADDSSARAARRVARSGTATPRSRRRRSGRRPARRRTAGRWRICGDAIGNPRRDAAVARRRAEYERQAAEYRLQEAREREAERPRCASCGTKFTDQRWSEVDKPRTWGEEAESHPKLCVPCKTKAKNAERAVKAAKREQRLAAEAAAAEAEAERKANRFLSRFRP
jgi:hypothetical protein